MQSSGGAALFRSSKLRTERRWFLNHWHYYISRIRIAGKRASIAKKGKRRLDYSIDETKLACTSDSISVSIRKDGPPPLGERQKVHMRFVLPKGKVADIMHLVYYLESVFSNVQIELKADGGQITDAEYEGKIEEALQPVSYTHLTLP